MQNLKRVLSLVTTLAMLLGVMSVAVFADDGTSATAAVAMPTYVAEITTTDDQGNTVVTQYESLQAAVNAVPNDGTETTIKLLCDTTDGGVALYNKQDPSHIATNKNIVIDFDNHTYTIGNPLVGSAGHKSQAFHLEKGNSVTLKNGTVDTTDAKMLVQNYCNLTLEDMTLDGSKLVTNDVGFYTVSNNYGTLTVKGDTNIIAKEGGVAFDLWYGNQSVYDDNGVKVVFDDSFTGTVDGMIEYGAASRIDNGKNYSSWQDKTVLVINGNGTFNCALRSGNSKNVDTLDTANITINGGTFTNDLGHAGSEYAYYTTVGDDSTFTVAPTAGYTVTFYDEDGNTVGTQTLEYGAMPTAPTASKQTDGVYVYSFAGWDKTVDAVTGDATYTARFNATLIPVKEFKRDYEIVPNNTPVAATTTIEEELVPLAELPVDFEDEINAEAVADFAATLGIVENVADFDAKAEIAGNAVVEALAAVTAESKTEIDVAAIAETAGIDLDAPVTREQIVTVLFTLAEAQGFDVSARTELAQFADADNISDYAQAAIQWAVSVGLLKGGDANMLAPDGIVTQEQLIILLLRFAELTK